MKVGCDRLSDQDIQNITCDVLKEATFSISYITKQLAYKIECN